MPQAKERKNIRTLSFANLSELLEKQGEKPFRAKQIWEWLWQKSARDFSEMTSLSKSFRELLNDQFCILPIITVETQKSNDGTIKSAFRLHDGHVVEGVLIPTKKRMTACISSQVGCSLTCKFCATGKLDRVRNLDASEMYDQVVLINKQAEEFYKKPLTNIVYMGMGEPLLNYKNLLVSIDHITSEGGLGMSPKRITVSTAGIAKMIRQLGDDNIKFNFALSLHAANDEKRSCIMPINEQNSIAELAKSLKYFYGKTGAKVTYEYIIFDGFNDELSDAQELEAFCKHVPSKVNIIEYNPIDGEKFMQASVKKVTAFTQYLENQGIITRIRSSRGRDVDAACGQLANKNLAVKA